MKDGVLAYVCDCGAGQMTNFPNSKQFLMEAYQSHLDAGHKAELVDRDTYEARFPDFWWREEQCPDCRNLLKHKPDCTNEKVLDR